MNSKQLAAFRAVMLAGSMSDASRMLYVSQPAVSRLIKDLEESLGFTLFDRRNSRLYPTQAAHAFYREVERHFIGMDNLSQAADQIRMMRSGRLRIGAMPALAFSVMPTIVSRFLRSHGDVSAVFAPHLSVELANRVGAQQFDLGVVMLPVESKEIAYGPCYKIDCVCIAPKGHRFADQEKVHASDLHREPFVAIGQQNTVTRFLIDSALRENLARPDERMETLLLSTAASMVKEGLGVSIVDAFTAHTFADDNLIVRPFEPSVPLYFGFITPVNRPVSGLAQEFIDSFEAYAAYNFPLTPIEPDEVGVV
ncbi:LysR substrate-binding domain-containing protein [Pontibacterium granulatum]|uniref:LysR substrate-binding domain-containing protein n=1 Tax=Pontibacterium granulatum TaxID=2036029 RepID=UPI00249A0F1D|nr:LysR substrate-binding domain-containing protein [Pontibacterium granulatum]MDI3324252.1 LysR substrate-binding domain-containing protein [Pontibacterium granulatum]